MVYRNEFSLRFNNSLRRGTFIAVLFLCVANSFSFSKIGSKTGFCIGFNANLRNSFAVFGDSSGS